MHKPCYSIEKFLSNFSQVTTKKALNQLIQSDKNLEMVVNYRSVEGSWYVSDDMFSPNSKLLIMPKVWIAGEVYEAPWTRVEMRKMEDLEVQFLEALKRSAKTLQRSWA